MEVYNYSEVPNNSSGQSIFRLVSNVESEPLYFLQELYKSPPRISIAWKDLEAQRTSCETGTHQLVTSKKPTTFIGSQINRNRSVKILNRYTETIKNALQSVPVYVLVNGRNELVVATSKPVKYPDSNLLSQSKRQRFGFIFLDKREADLYLAEITRKVDTAIYTERTTGLSQVGLSIHCIGLDYAYHLFRHEIDVDFRFVPNLNQVTYLLENVNPSDISTYSPYSQPITVDIPDDEYRDLDNLMIPDLDHAEVSSFRGVPVYVIQLKDVPYATAQENMLKMGSFTDDLQSKGVTFSSISSRITEKVSPSILDYYPDLFVKHAVNKTEQNLKIEDLSIPSKIESVKSRISNYVFFDKVQAEQFGLNCNQYLVKNTTLSSFGRTQIFSLEGFLEMWENAILLKQDFNEGKFNFNSKQSTYFIPSKESLKILKDYAAQPKKSLSKSINLWAQSKLIKLRWLQHDYLGLVLRGYRL